MRPGEEEDHGWGVLCFGCADRGEDAFEIVLDGVQRGREWWVDGGWVTQQTPGMPYLPFAASESMMLALLELRLSLALLAGRGSAMLAGEALKLREVCGIVDG